MNFCLFLPCKWRRWATLCILGIGSILTLMYSRYTSSNISDVLKLLPEEDHASLDALFRRLLLKDHFAYALFGDKAIAISGYFSYNNHNFSLGHLAVSLNKSNIKIRNGCNIWKKYNHLFQLKSHLLLIEEELEDNVWIVIINKRNFLKTFNQYSSLFRRVLGKNITGEALLKQIEIKGILKKEALNDNEELLGLLLGFGKKNSYLYQRHEEIRNVQNQVSISLLKKTSKQSFEDELEDIEARLLLFDDPVRTSFCFMNYPYFRADRNDPETQELLEKYICQRKKITKLYRKGKFLETTLQKLCS